MTAALYIHTISLEYFLFGDFGVDWKSYGHSLHADITQSLSLLSVSVCRHLLKHQEVSQMSGEASSTLSRHSDSLLLHALEACLFFNHNINTVNVNVFMPQQQFGQK